MAALFEARSERGAVRQCEGNLWWTLLWGVPDEADVEMVVRAWDRAVEIGAPYRSLVDAASVRHVDPVAFRRLADYLSRRREALLPLLSKQAVVRPEGVVGAVAAGVLAIAGWAAPVSVFTDAHEAMLHL